MNVNVKLILIVVTQLCYASVNAQRGSEGYQKLLETCCLIGTRNAQSNTGSNNCDPNGAVIEQFLRNNRESQYQCKASFRICCIREQRSRSCEQGKELAINGGSCPSFAEDVNVKNESFHVETLVDCCHSCVLGRNAGKQNYDCNSTLVEYGENFGESYFECCKMFKEKSANIETGLCQRNNVCEQICDDITTNRLQCRCNEGFRLSRDQRSCSDIDECLEGLHNCGERQKCSNQRGSFRCINTVPPVNYSSPTTGECPPGFTSTAQNELICVDIDECANRLHDCSNETQYCDNFKGGYRCVEYGTGIIEHKCPTGHIWIESRCVDIDECNRDEHQCDARTEKCLNIVGSYRCIPLSEAEQCTPGYRYSGSSHVCVDQNECEDPYACGRYKKCENTVGSFRCSCMDGFREDPLTGQCIDVNECQLNIHNCENYRRCDNTIGSYECVRELSCGTGYTFNADTDVCEDDDECALGTHNCPLDKGFVCRNMQGSFRCEQPPCPSDQIRIHSGDCVNSTCSPGFRFDLRSEKCEDVNECQRSVCRSYETCRNTIGSYLCVPNVTCESGLQFNKESRICEDINECENGIHSCSNGQICRNTYRGYTCTCQPGYTEDSSGRCQDIDECSLDVFPCQSRNSICENTKGSYRCVCNPGFRSDERGKCVDVDECNDIPNLCSQSCVNTYGSYQCRCKIGYILHADGRSCDDFDECEGSNTTSRSSSSRRCLGNCRNTQGSYECECPTGYRLGSDGHSCIDIDECKEYNICKGSDDTCLNTRGGYKCFPFECPKGFQKDQTHKSRCIRPIQPESKPDLTQPLSYSFSYLAIPSNIRIPPSGRLEMITIRGPLFRNIRASFTLNLDWAQAKPQISRVSRDFFTIHETGFNEAKLYLLRSIEGPQEMKLDLGVKMYHNGYFGGESKAIVFITVSEYDF